MPTFAGNDDASLARRTVVPRRRCGRPQRGGLFRHRRHGRARGPAKLGAGSGADPGAAVRRFRHKTFGARRRRLLGRRRRRVGRRQGRPSRLESPAQRLGLDGKPRAHAEKCLDRGDLFRGARRAVSRPASGGAGGDEPRVLRLLSARRLRRGVSERRAIIWPASSPSPAKARISARSTSPICGSRPSRSPRTMLDGKIWLADIGHATHYHAYWVHPSWVHEMVRLYKLGVHTFYRPRAWGDGDDEPAWGPAPRSRTRPEADKPQAAATRRRSAPSAASPRAAAEGRASRSVAGAPKWQPPMIAAASRRCCSTAYPGACRRAKPRNDSYISISSPTSRFCTEWVSAPDDR